MFQDFRVISVDTDLKTKSILITANFDIDPETAIEANIQIYDKVTRNDIEFVVEILGKAIKLNLKDWPIPNAEYVIAVQNLKTVLGDPLVSGVRRKIIFESSICSKVDITYPAFNEVITDLKLKWKETAVDPNQPLVNSFYVEISTENSFYNLVKKTVVDGRTEVDLTDLRNGQYYVRVRAQQGEQYGSWSEIITFMIGDTAAAPEPVYDGDKDDCDDTDDIYTPEIEILSFPENGETPTSIIIEFDCEIDPDSIEDIIVMRRKI